MTEKKGDGIYITVASEDDFCTSIHAQETALLSSCRARGGGRGMLVGRPSSLADGIPARGRSFAPTLPFHRLRPVETAVAAAGAQVCSSGDELPSGLGWRAALDRAYGKQKFFVPLHDKAVQVVARTRADRVFFRPADPATYAGQGRHARCLARRFVFAMRRPGADEVLALTDPWHGEVALQLWRNRRQRGTGKFVGVAAIRSPIHLEAKQPPQPHW